MSKRIKLGSQIDSGAVGMDKGTQLPWGRLIACLPQLDSIDLLNSSITLGRSHECDILIYKSKFLPSQIFYISKKHFGINQDPQDNNIVYITDYSKNGTYVNHHLVGKNKRAVLQNNDSIAIGEQLTVYIFKSMKYIVAENYLPQTMRDKYVPSRLLGTGACGEVRLVYDKFTCKQFAVKKVTKGRDTPSQIHTINHPSRIHTEVEILQSLSHPLIVKLYDVAETDNDVFIVLEYLKGGELNSKISSNKKQSESQVKFLFYQIILAVQYLHSQGIAHRDLKPSNVLLLDSQPYSLLKLTDFGLSKITNGFDAMKTICGTWHFIAPEVLNTHVTLYSNQADIWSLGVILYYMLSNNLPFQSEEKTVLMKLILKGTYHMQGFPWCNVSDNAKDLVKKMLIVDPRKRITIEEILGHPWISTDNLMRFQVEKLMASINDESDPG